MKPLHFFALLVISGICSFACKNEPKPALPSEISLPTPPPSPKPEVYLYSISVDKLNLRDQPNKNGKVVFQFPEGDFVEGLGEISANKEEVTLRNIPYNEPYLKVTSTTPEQYTGWAYSAGLVPIYAGSRATLPDLGKLSEFAMFLKTLNVKQLESGKKAWDYASKNLSGAQGTLADAAFILLERFLFRMEVEGNFYEMTEKVKWEDADYQAISKKAFNMQKYPETKAIALNGFRLEEGEGMIFPTVDWSKLGDFFAKSVTPAMKNYLEQSVSEQNEKLWDDGGIMISLESVADRAARWEKFNQANPYFVRNEETMNAQHGLIFMLICGANNTPVFTGEEPQIVTEEFKKAWAYVQEKYAGTELGRSVKEMADVVAAEGGKRTKKVDAVMEKYMTQ